MVSAIVYPGLWSKFDFRSMKEQLSYAMPLGAAALVYTLHRDLHNYFVGHRVDAATFAIYSVGCFQLPLIGLLQESVTAILLPKMTKLHKEGRNQDILALMRGAMRKQALVYWPVYFLFLVVAQEFLTFIYTRRFIDSTPIFRVYLTLLPINILVIDPIVRVFLECRYFLLRMRIWVMLVMLVALYLSVRQFGMIGAISVVALAAVAESALSARRIFRILEARTADVIPMFTEAGSIGVLAGISAIPVWFLRQPLSGLPLAVSLIVSGIVFSALYVTLLIVFHIPTAEEMEQVKKGIRSVRTRFARLLPAGAENI